MASTSNKNTQGNYYLEQRRHTLGEAYAIDSKMTNCCAMPNVGITPSSLPRDKLSCNPVEIESMLFGINSTNLVTPRPVTKPRLTKLPEKQFFNRIPLILPSPLVVEKNQRPLHMA